MRFSISTALALAAVSEAGKLSSPHERRGLVSPKQPVQLRNAVDDKMNFPKRQDIYPAPVQGYRTIESPEGVTLRVKEPGKEGICETTPGVNSYSGYIDLAPDMHAFFWFFESRSNPSSDPITLWLNGGPGSDSQIGLFQELGPCNVTEDLKTMVNPYSWTNVSNFIFLSQPYGVGFSYQSEEKGSQNNYTGAFQDAQTAPPTGRYPVINATAIDTTELAAMAAWHIIQGFYDALPQLDGKLNSIDFNLWTESYGGHYGPTFFNYFQEQNNLIASNMTSGKHLNMVSLGIGNGIINEKIQAPMYPEFATKNTYGIKAYNDTVYDYAKFALNMPNGCLDQYDLCFNANQSTIVGQSICAEAADMCRDNVEGVYYAFGGRGVYDIRHPYDDPTPPSYFVDFLNQPDVQQAIGVNLNYTSTSNTELYYSFQQTGDFVYPNFLEDLSNILNSGVRVSLFYGDADYICNWFGGEAVSLAVNYTHADMFRRAGYAPMMVDGVEVGEVRQYGNFSFARVYEAGHEVPYYQPAAAFAVFNRSISLVDIATGMTKITPDLNTSGPANATHRESFVALPSSTMGPSASATAYRKPWSPRAHA